MSITQLALAQNPFSGGRPQVYRSGEFQWHNCVKQVVGPTIGVVIAVAVVLFAATQAVANPIPGLYNTGVDNSNVLLGNLVVDAHYQLDQGPAVTDGTRPNSYTYADITPVTNIYPGSWVNNTATSQWIGPSDDITRKAIRAGPLLHRISTI